MHTAPRSTRSVSSLDLRDLCLSNFSRVYKPKGRFSSLRVPFKKTGADIDTEFDKKPDISTPDVNLEPDSDLQSKVDPYPGPLSVPRPSLVPWEDVILLQAFGWESSKQHYTWYETVQRCIPTIAAAGFTHAWLPPPSRSVSKEGYLPTQLYDVSSSYGSHDALVALNTELLSSGIRPVADIVINHRSADEQNENGVWNRFKDIVPHPGRRIDWGPEAITGNDPEYQGRGHADSGADYGPSPDLDHDNEDVRRGLSDWMVWLRDYIGFEGWRLDFAKGYSPKVAQFYLNNTLHHPGKDFCVAEYWMDAAWEGTYLSRNQNAMRQGLCDWMDASGAVSSCFDFTTKAILQEAIKRSEYDRLRDEQGKPPGLLGWWPQRAVTFVDNHDTGSSQQHWPFPASAILQGYAYILTHPGIPCIFWEHLFQSSEHDQKTIIQLIEIRKKAGIRADSPIEILLAESDVYAAKIGENVIIKLGPRFDPGKRVQDIVAGDGGWKVVLAGNNWAIWLRSS